MSKDKRETMNLSYQIYRCHWCNVDFWNRRNLVRHLRKCQPRIPTAKPRTAVIVIPEEKPYRIPDIVIPKEKLCTPKTQKCSACQKTWSNTTHLRLHIRKCHFNLQAKMPYCEKKKVNQVWFEKVLNCNIIMEMRKTAPNTLVMKKLDENTSIKVIENNSEIIDLTHLYPTDRVKVLNQES